jgi:hypothetical protein
MKMSRYKVMVDDNFHYMDEGERSEYTTFPTADEAIETCRRLVDESLLEEYRSGATADELYERYISFGDEPFVVAIGGAEKVEFSARNYARRRVQELAAPGAPGSRLRAAVLDRKGALSRSLS